MSLTLYFLTLPAARAFGACDLLEMGAFADPNTKMYLELGCRIERTHDQVIAYKNVTETLGKCGENLKMLDRFDRDTHDFYKLFTEGLPGPFSPFFPLPTTDFDAADKEWQIARKREREELVESLARMRQQRELHCPVYTTLCDKRSALCLAFAGSSSKVSWEALKVGRLLREAHCTPVYL